MLIWWGHIRSTQENGIALLDEVNNVVRQVIIVREVRLVVNHLGGSARRGNRSDVDVFGAVSAAEEECVSMTKKQSQRIEGVPKCLRNSQTKIKMRAS